MARQIIQIVLVDVVTVPQQPDQRFLRSPIISPHHPNANPIMISNRPTQGTNDVITRYAALPEYGRLLLICDSPMSEKRCQQVEGKAVATTQSNVMEIGP
jgi:hypothetical protein